MSLWQNSRVTTFMCVCLLTACADDKSAAPGPDASVTDPDSMPGTSEVDATDAGSVDPNHPALNQTPTQSGISEDGEDVASLADFGAHVGRITTQDTGFHGLWAHCQQGDFRLYNETVEVCVQAEKTNRHEMFSGGAIVDLRRRGDTSDDVFDLLKPRVGLNVGFAERVYVVRDGSQGGPAVVRVDGYDSPVAYILGMVGGKIFKSDGLKFTTEFRLWPASTEVEIVSWVTNTSAVNKSITPGEWLAPGDRTEVFRDKYGFLPSTLNYRWLATVGESNSVTWYGEEDMAIDELPFSDNNPWLLTKFPVVPLAAGETYAWRRWLGIGDGTLASTQGARSKRISGEERTLKKVSVKYADGAPAAGRRVSIDTEDTAMFFGVTDGNGELKASWDISSTLTVEPIPGHAATRVDLAAGDLEVSVEVPNPATLMVNATTDGAPTNALVRVRAPGVETEFFATGRGSIELAPGMYTIQVTRGLEYDVIESQVTLEAGGTDFNADLVRSVDTAGWIAADFHQHMEPSSDSAVNINLRVTDNVCEGVEFVAPTDHDVTTNLQPWIDRLGFTDVLNTFSGLEVSPTTGHVGIYPMPYDPSRRGNGAITLAYIDGADTKYRPIPEVFAAARQMSTNPVIQLNHPRGGTSLFDTTGFDPTRDDPRTYTNTDWSTDFDTMEVINRFSSTCETFADFAQFLNVGLKKTGLGNADTHTLDGNPAGTPRNYLPIAAQPGQIDGMTVRDMLKAGRVTVGAHAFLDFTDGKLPGDTVVGANQTFGVRVQTPSYSQATRLHVVVNGEVVESLDRSGTNGNDFDETIHLAVTKDSWVVFFAMGPRANAWEYGDPTLAFSNPIFIDIAGDGWQEPGMSTLSLNALNESGFCN